jgi:hypothetical protein
MANASLRKFVNQSIDKATMDTPAEKKMSQKRQTTEVSYVFK